ncbi:hypothetical protein EDB83DRAFT_2212392, partial [Lactarius deliciosus]
DKEAKLQEASNAVTNGELKNVAEAARHFKVPYDTLRRRHYGLTGPHLKSQVKKQLLSEAQEKALCEWIKYMGRIGYPLSKQNLHAKVAYLSQPLQERMRQMGKELLPSKNWIKKFLYRHIDITLKRPTGLDAQRARCFNPAVV